MPRGSEVVRLLSNNDMPQVRRLLQTSEYIYQRFTLEELSTIITHYPAMGIFNGTSLRGFVLSQTVYAPSAWLSGFCVSWTESRAYVTLFKTFLEHWARHLFPKEVLYFLFSAMVF